MKTLREIIQEAVENKVAVGHFNFSTFEVAQAIVDVAKEMNLPVILGLSEGERDFVGVHQAVAWVQSIRAHHHPMVFLNADHTYSLERVKEAVEAGFDMVIFDGASKDIEENISQSKLCRQYIDAFNRERKCDILLEAELGYIGKSSQWLFELPEGLEKTTPELAKRLVEEVKPDLLAPAIGNVHGMLKNSPNPALDFQLCKQIYEVTQVPLVLHGGSGSLATEVQECIRNKVAVVHINTELRVAYKKALQESLQSEDLAPYKYLQKVKNAVQAVIREKLNLFSFKSLD